MPVSSTVPGLTNQKDYWTKGVNYSAKAQFLFPNVNLVLSTQKIKPSDVTVTMYDGGITFHKGGFIAEAEYLYKHYSKDAFHDVHAFDGFVCYDIPVAIRRASSGRFRHWQDMIS